MLLAQREHLRLELQRKLAAHVEEGDDLNAVLDELERRGFISAERVVESVMRSKASRYGAERPHDLRSKGLDEETVRQASSCAAASCRCARAVVRSVLAAFPSTSRKRPGSCAFWLRAAFRQMWLHACCAMLHTAQHPTARTELAARSLLLDEEPLLTPEGPTC